MNKQGNFVIQGVEYILTMDSTEEILNVELECRYDPQIWRNQYTKQYIEDITQKTGSYKKFSVFVQMLGSAISKSSEQVQLEILTYQDLENMKQQKMQSTGSSFKSSSSAPQQPQKNNKRYIIMSYSSEFEKVHYPLPLNFEENIDSEKLKSTILRMKDELELTRNGKVLTSQDEFQNSRDSFNRSKASIGTMDTLKNENEILRAKIKRLEESQTQKLGAVEVDNLIKEKHSLLQELEELKNNYSRDIQKFQQEANERNKELILKTAEINAFKQELTKLIGRENVDAKIQGYIKAMNDEDESQLQKAKNQLLKQEKETERLSQEVENYKKLDAKQKQRIRQLEVELETSMKKFNHKGITDRLYSPFSNKSAGSKKSNYSAPNRNSNQVSPNSSKNSFNSRNSQGSVPSVRNRTFNPSPGRGVNAFTRKPQSGTVQKTTPIRPSQTAQQRIQSVQVKPQIQASRTSPQISRSPGIRQNNPPVNRNQVSPQQRPTQALTNALPARQPLNQRTSPNRMVPPPKQNVQRGSVPAQQRNIPVKNGFTDDHLGKPKGNDLDNKINNLRSLLQQAKR